MANIRSEQMDQIIGAHPQPRKSGKYFWFTLLGVILGVLLGRVVVNWLWHTQTTSSPKTQDLQNSKLTAISQRKTAEQIAAPHLEKAKRAAEQAIENRLRDIDAFFAAAKKGVPQFAEAALGWRSKFRWLWDHMPLTDSDGHKKLIAAEFEKYIFSRHNLEQALLQTISIYIQEIHNIENKMLVELQADLADFPEYQALSELDKQQLRTQFEKAIDSVRRDVQDSIQLDIGLNVASLIVGEVLARVVLTRLGLGLVMGIIVDQIISNWLDTEGQLIRELNRQLDELHHIIVHDPERGLRAQLKKLAEERAVCRQAAIMSLLKPEQR